jgi:hypothetical protein
MCKAPTLTTPNFTKTFIVECDDSRNGIGVVPMQEGRHLDFESQLIKGKNLHKSIYEKEMLAILHALKQWHPYLNTSQSRDYLQKSKKKGNQDVGI